MSETTGPISILLGRNVPFVTLYQVSSSHHDWSKTMAARGGAYFSYISILKMFLSETLDRFQFDTAEKFPWWPSTKIVQAIMIRNKTLPPRGRAYFEKILSETVRPSASKFGMELYLVAYTKSVQILILGSEMGPPVCVWGGGGGGGGGWGGGSLVLHRLNNVLYSENLENSSCRKPLGLRLPNLICSFT